MKKIRIDIRVRYADTDAMKVVYHSNYFVWCEMGRTELLRSSGFSYKSIEENGISMPVIECKMNYKIPAVYDDIITVETNLTELSKVKLKLSYKIIHKAEGYLIAEGYTVHCFINISKNRPVRAPEQTYEILQSIC